MVQLVSSPIADLARTHAGSPPLSTGGWHFGNIPLDV